MTAIQGMISLAALSCLVLLLYNKYRVDLLRQELFEIRDALFDEAVAGRISFDSHAYQATRFLLNGMLRFAHELSLARFVVALSILRWRKLEVGGESFDIALNASPESDRKLCRHFVARANASVARHLMRSPFAVPLLVPLASFLLTLVGVNLTAKFVKGMRKNFGALDRVAYAEGLAN